MVLRFKIQFDCNNKIPKLKKEDATWVPTDWADYIDPDAMTTILGDPIYNIEEEEYWEAYQQTLKSPHELRANHEDEERGVAPSDDENEREDKSDSNRDNSRSDSGRDDDDSNPKVMTTIVEVMIAHTMLMIGVNPLMIEKMKMQTYLMRNRIVMWTTMIKIYKTMPKPTGGVTLIVINTG